MSKTLESRIDTLLLFIHDEHEKDGSKIGNLHFDFNEGGEDQVIFAAKESMSWTDLSQSLNVCLTRDYLVHKLCGCGDYGGLALTREGQARALSVKLVDKNITEHQSSSVTIGTFITHAPTQVGNGNIQNIESIFSCIQQRIDESYAPAHEKEEVKGLISRLLKHPLFCAIVGGVTSGIATQKG